MNNKKTIFFSKHNFIISFEKVHNIYIINHNLKDTYYLKSIFKKKSVLLNYKLINKKTSFFFLYSNKAMQFSYKKNLFILLKK